MGAINKLMDMLNIGSSGEQEVEYVEEQNYEEVSQEEEEARYTNRNRRNFSDIESANPYSSKNLTSKVIPMNNMLSSSKMVITQPTCYSDVQSIGEYLKGKQSLIINLENIGKEEAEKILDFMSGATFMAEGTMQKVSNLIYLITPKNIEIQNDVEKTQYKQKMSFSWMK